MTNTDTLAAQSGPAVPHGAVQVDAAVDAASALLAALGLDADTEHLRESAKRMVASCRELLTSVPFAEMTFSNAKGHHGFVIVRDVPFAALCAHHVLPFRGLATVGYQPGERLLGLSKLARTVDQHAKGLRVQEDVTEDIAGSIDAATAGNGGVGVIVRAEHLCMVMRGVRALGSSTVTTAWRGMLAGDAARRAEFLALAAGR
jgi:GTP cyclohydrolase I